MDAPLPVREGVAPSRVYLPAGAWSTIYCFLMDRYPHLPDGVIRARLQRGDIVDSQGVALSAESPYVPQQWLWYYREVPNEAVVPFDMPVLLADDTLVVADKPHFLASTPGGRYVQQTALTRLRRQRSLPQLSPIHRLDRETAGVLLFCVEPEHRGAYQTLFQRREVRKVYEAIAPQRTAFQQPYVHRSRIVPGDQFLMTETTGEPNSETCIELIKSLGNGLALYRVEPLTGRKHQIRVHMSALGIPILNDELYPALLPHRRVDDFSRPLQLLARSISFVDPLSGKNRYFESQRQLAL